MQILYLVTAVLGLVAGLTIYFGGSPVLAISLAANVGIALIIFLVGIALGAFYAGKLVGIRMVEEKLQEKVDVFYEEDNEEDKEAAEDAAFAIEEVRRDPFKMPPSQLD